MIFFDSFSESIPLGLLCCDELVRKSDDLIWKFCPPLLKRQPDGFRQDLSIKSKMAGKQPDVIEILHPAIQLTMFQQ